MSHNLNIEKKKSQNDTISVVPKGKDNKALAVCTQQTQDSNST